MDINEQNNKLSEEKDLKLTFHKESDGNDKFKKFVSVISYSILPFLLFIITIGLTWGLNQLLNKPANLWPEIPLDSKIPVVSWFVYFYYLTFPLGIFCYFYLAYVNRKGLYNMWTTIMICYFISGIIYFFWQTEMIKPVFEAVTFTDKLVVQTWGSSNPICCLPSQHCYMAIIMVLGTYSEKKMPLWFRLLIGFFAIMIVLSTVFIRQHYVLDFVASFVTMVPIYYLIRGLKVGDKMENKFCKKIKTSK